MTDVTLIIHARSGISPHRPSPSRLAAPYALRILTAVCALHAWPVVAAPADEAPDEGFAVNLGQSVRWEDNLFRLPDGESPPDGGSRSDRVSRSTAGLGFRHTYGLQRIAADVEVAHRSYAEHDELDATTRSASGRWDWAVGKQWTGTATLLQRQAPRSFDDTDQRIRSINTLRRGGVDANYWWHPDWSLLAGAERTRSRFSDDRSAASEYDETAFEAGVGFRPKTGNRLSLVARRAHGDYPNRTPSATIDSGYEQRDLRLRGEWALTGISKLSGYLGYTSREYEHVNSLDFDGPTGRIAFDWVPTGKLSFQFVARREIGSEYEVIDNYVVTRGLGVEGRWAATDKIGVRARAEQLWRDRGNVGVTALDDDRTRLYGLSVDYAPLRTLTISASAQRAQRSAAGRASDYSADLYGLDARLEF